MVVLTVWLTLCIPTILVPLSQGFKVVSVLVAVGFGMVPVAAVGLWNKKKWGIIVLMIATLLTFIVTIRLDMIMGHLVLLGLAAFYYSTGKPSKSKEPV